MKTHILTALVEEFDLWQELIDGMDNEQVPVPHPPDKWSIKDESKHL